VLLFDAGCDPAVKDVHGRAAIHYAASNGYLGIVEVIAAGDGDLEIFDERGCTPLECARERGHMNVGTFLKRKRLIRERKEDERK